MGRPTGFARFRVSFSLFFLKIQPSPKAAGASNPGCHAHPRGFSPVHLLRSTETLAAQRENMQKSAVRDPLLLLPLPCVIIQGTYTYEKKEGELLETAPRGTDGKKRSEGEDRVPVETREVQ